MWKSRAVGTAALLTLPLTLAACGGGSSTAASSSTTQSSSTTTSSTTTSSSAPSGTTSSSGAPSPSSSTSSSSSASSSADNSGKPDKKAAAAGLSKILRTTKTGAKITTAQSDRVATCVVNRAYDKLTAKTLNAMVTGDSKSDPDNADGPVFTATVAYCAKAAGIVTPTSSTS